MLTSGYVGLVYADVTPLIGYQGRVADPAGNAVNGVQSFVFKIYCAQTGGTALWTEQQTVPVNNGLFSVFLGSVTPLDLPFDTDYWVEITFGSETMSPRQRLTSAAYAINADRLDGYDSNNFYVKNRVFTVEGSIPAIVLSDTQSNSKSWGIYAGSPSTGCFKIKNITDVKDNLVIDINGNVGIGTTNPSEKLDVAGNINISSSTSRTLFFGGYPAGVGAPGAGSKGEKIQLYGTAGTIGVSDYAIGIEGSNMWFNSNYGYKWYADSVVRSAFSYQGTQTWYVNDGTSEAGKIYLGTPGGKPGIAFFNTSGTGRSQIKQLSSTGGLSFGATTTGDNPGDEMVLTTGGNVGIGTTSPGNKLTVYSTGDNQLRIGYNSDWYWDIERKAGDNLEFYNWSNGIGGTRVVFTNDGNVGIGTMSPGYKLTVNGTAWCSEGSWSGSDVRWKKQVTPLTGALDKIVKLQGVYYYWRSDEYPDLGFSNAKQIGLIGQDTEKIVPEVVTTDSNGYKGISYEKLVPLLIEAVKEQQREIEELKKIIAEKK